MSLKEYDVGIEKITKDTYDIKTFRLEKPEGYTFKPGQFLIIKVPVKIRGEMKKVPRSYSILSPPQDEFIELGIKLVPMGLCTPVIFEFEEGDTITITDAMGKFFFEGNESDNIVLIGGGSGICPLYSIIKNILNKELPVKATLLFSNRTEEDIPYREEFEEFAKNENIKIIHTLTREAPENWEGLEGRISKEMFEKNLEIDENTIFFLCGPPGFVEAGGKILQEMDVPKEKIKIEAW